MYIIVNKTQQTCTKSTGSFPNLDKELDRGDRIIIISLYSNCIKVPYYEEYNGIKEWCWEEFPVDYHVLKQYKQA
jgi:hypothetical protein